MSEFARRIIFGVARILLDRRWETEPGWFTLSIESAALCAVIDEIGGRCQMRSQPDLPAGAEYFGTGHLSFGISAAG